MKFMPEFEETEGFPAPSDDLPRLALHEWGPLFFTSLDPACDFEEWIRPVRERVDWLRPERFRLHEAHSTDYLIQASWAMYCDNYLEGFHVPYVHAASLGDKLDYEGYHTELFDWSNVQIGVARAGEPAFDLGPLVRDRLATVVAETRPQAVVRRRVTWLADALDLDVERVRAVTGRIDLVHLNNSRDEFDSARDRHANLADGQIDPALLVEVATAAGAPIILETPEDGMAEDIAFLREKLG